MAQLPPLQAVAARLMAAPDRKVRWLINQRGRLAALQGRLTGAAALPELRAYLGDVRRHESAGKPLDAEQAPIVASAGLVLGDALQRAGQAVEAAACWSAAADRLHAGGQRGHVPSMALLGLIALRQGRAQDARLWAERVEPTTYRHPDAAELRRWAGQQATPVR